MVIYTERDGKLEDGVAIPENCPNCGDDDWWEWVRAEGELVVWDEKAGCPHVWHQRGICDDCGKEVMRRTEGVGSIMVMLSNCVFACRKQFGNAFRVDDSLLVWDERSGRR